MELVDVLLEFSDFGVRLVGVGLFEPAILVFLFEEGVLELNELLFHSEELLGEHASASLTLGSRGKRLQRGWSLQIRLPLELNTTKILPLPLPVLFLLLLHNALRLCQVLLHRPHLYKILVGHRPINALIGNWSFHHP